jgi:hypothetical protein
VRAMMMPPNRPGTPRGRPNICINMVRITLIVTGPVLYVCQ